MGLHLRYIPGPADYFQGLVVYLSLLKVSFDWAQVYKQKLSARTAYTSLAICSWFSLASFILFSIFCTFLIFLLVGVLIHWVFVVQNM